jgi:hypothetical protein
MTDAQYARFNVPGAAGYTPSKPVDIILRSTEDSRKRGYWLARDVDGQIVFMSNNSEADQVVTGEDIDGVPTITWDTVESDEFNYDGYNTISITRRS